VITNARARRPWNRPTALFIVLACLLVQAITATATATATPAKHARSSHGPVGTGARLLPPALKAIARRKRQADRKLVARAKGVKRCLRANPKHPNRCRSARRALQRAGVKLTVLERKLARVAGSTGTANATASRSTSRRSGYNNGLRAARVAPTLTVSGAKLSWNRVDNINTYVLLIRVPKEAVQYSVVTGLSMTPPPVPGDTVSYSVRTTTEGSSWSTEKSITYAAAKEIEKLKAPEEVKIPVKTPEEKKAPEEVKAPEKVDTQAAPELTVSGEKLVWNSIAGVTTYVLVTKVPGKTEAFSEVSGTSTTPAAVPGVTVHYSVRTAVEGSALSPEVAITYPAATPPPSEGSGGSAGSGQQQFIDGINNPLYNSTTANELVGAGIVGARNGAVGNLSAIKSAGYVMADTDEIVGDTADGSPLSGVNVSSWTSSTLKEVEQASADGVVLMEVGNEMFLKDESAHEGQKYGEMYLSLYNAVQSSSVASKVKLLANSYGASWLADMVKASSSLKADVQGFTMHPYGLPHENNSGNWGPGALEAEHAEAVKLGFAHTEYWATEYGVELDGSGANGASTEAIKAEHIKQVYEELIATGYVGGMYYYQVGDDGTGGNGKWGIVEPSGAERTLPFNAVASFKDIFVPAE